MSKLKGSYKSGLNIEVTTSAPLDPRVKWDSWDSLTDSNDWPVDEDNKPYLYSGLVVSVNDGTNDNPNWNVYILNNVKNWDKKPTENDSGWKPMNGMMWTDA